MRLSKHVIRVVTFITRGVDIILSTKRGKLCTTILVYNLFFNHIFTTHFHFLFYGAGGLNAFADSTLPSIGRVTTRSISGFPGLFIFNEVIT